MSDFFDDQLVIDTASNISSLLKDSSLKGDDRRDLIEEECKKSLQKHQLNVSRYRDLMSAVGKHLNSLKQRADHFDEIMEIVHEDSMNEKLAEAHEDTIPPR